MITYLLRGLIMVIKYKVSVPSDFLFEKKYIDQETKYSTIHQLNT